jgi:hypothetical protein
MSAGSAPPFQPPQPGATGGRPGGWRRRVGLALLLATGLALIGLGLAFEDEPRVAESAEVHQADVDRAMALVRLHDPRRALPGIHREARIAERDLDVLLNHAARRWLGARVDVTLGDRHARVQASALWPGNPLGEWLNLSAELAQTRDGLPRWQSLQAGRLPLPVSLAEALMPWLLPRLGLTLDVGVAAEVVTETRFEPGLLHLGYAWRADSAERVLGSLLSPPEQERLVVYQVALAAAIAGRPPGWTVGMTDLLPPLFRTALSRTEAGADPAVENRAALLALTLYAHHISPTRIAPRTGQVAAPPPRHVLLGGRVDLPRHFLVSALLVTEGTESLATALGLHKERSDAQGGSGFSFVDMAANHAGMRLGRLAQEEARALQAMLAAGVAEPQIMPAVRDLPEQLDARELEHRFGGVEGEGYRRVMAQIEARVAALPALR